MGFTKLIYNSFETCDFKYKNLLFGTIIGLKPELSRILVVQCHKYHKNLLSVCLSRILPHGVTFEM